MHQRQQRRIGRVAEDAGLARMREAARRPGHAAREAAPAAQEGADLRLQSAIALPPEMYLISKAIQEPAGIRVLHETVTKLYRCACSGMLAFHQYLVALATGCLT